MITGYIKGQNLTIRTPMIAADTIDYLTAQFVFQTVDWEGCRLFSHWKCGEANYSIELSDAGKIEKEQHLNLTAGTWTVWIHGERYRDGELIQRITTDEATLTVTATGTAGGSPFPEVPASDLERINAEIAELQDKVGAGGASGKAEKPVTFTVDLAEDNSFVIADHTAEQLYEMAQNGEVRLLGFRANEDESSVILMADIRGGDMNDGVLYTAAANMQITSVPVVVQLNTNYENTNGTILEAPAAGASSSGGALNLQYWVGTLTDITLSKEYTYADVRAALLANRPITLTTYTDGGGETWGMYHVIPGASVGANGGIRFIGFSWTEKRGDVDEPLPDLGWTPKSAVLAQDGTLTFEDEWFEGYAKQAEVDSLSEAIANLQTGLTAAQISALDGMFKIASFTKDPTAEYTAFKVAFGIEDGGTEEPDEPENPDTPTVTLTSISATYSGGDVAVGTALTALTGIVVTATYSDGSTATVTGYTLSGTIAEGSNTITVSYGSMTTTFTVTGVQSGSGMVLGIYGAGSTYSNGVLKLPASSSARAGLLPPGQYLKKGATYKFSLGTAASTYYYGVQVYTVNAPDLVFEFPDSGENTYDSIVSYVNDAGWKNADYEYTVVDENAVLFVNFKKGSAGSIMNNTDYDAIRVNFTITEV